MRLLRASEPILRWLPFTATIVVLGLLFGIGAAKASAPWRPLPIHGADVRSLAIAPDNPDLVFAGTSGGHVYLSSDGGKTWKNAGEATPFSGWVVGTLHFDVNRPHRLWAGLWGVWGEGLIAYSEDGGSHWTLRRKGLPKAAIYAVATVPGAPGRLYAATRQGVFGTEDDGQTWLHLSASTPGLVNVSSLLVDPFDPSIIFAGTWRRAYRSDDGGKTWKGVFKGMVLDSEVFTLRAVADRRGEIWASTCGWVYRSPNRGESWRRYKNGLDERRSPSFLVMPDGTLLTGTVRGLYRSVDGGSRWQRTSPKDLAINTLALHPQRPQRLLVATEGAGVWVSDDGGVSLKPFPKGMTNLRVDALASLNEEVFAAVNHAGPFSGIYRLPKGGGAAEREKQEIPTVLDLASFEGQLFAATEKGLFERKIGEWRKIRELGDSRIEQLAANDTRLVARTPLDLFERFEGPFRRLSFSKGKPQAMALHGDAIWVTSGASLFRLDKEETQPFSMPVAPHAGMGSKLAVAGEELWLSGNDAVWRRRSPQAPWEEARGDAARLIETGHEEYPFLVLNDHAPSLLYHRPSTSYLEISLPAAPWEVRGALIQGDQILLATAGQGLLISPLPPFTTNEQPSPGFISLR